MTAPEVRTDEGLDASPRQRSMAQQVMYWLMLVSLVVAVAVMGAWWIAEDIPFTFSTTFIWMFATGGVWMTVYRLFILGIRRLVRARIAQGKAQRG